MTNQYGIPPSDLDTVVDRDKDCVYCHKTMNQPSSGAFRGDWATIEHLNHRQDWDSVGSYVSEGKSVPTIIAICCSSCNSSRGSKSLRDWFRTNYCRDNKISYATVSQIVRDYINMYEAGS